MNSLAFVRLLPILMLAACQSTPVAPVVQQVPGEPIPIQSQAAVRTGEVVKAYKIGRYRDPVDPRIMHEGHVVYRVERSSDFRTDANYGDQILVGPSLGLRGPGYVQGPIPKELGAELVRQRRATAEATAEMRRVNEATGDIQASLRQMPVLQSMAAATSDRVDAVNTRQRALEETNTRQEEELKRLRAGQAELEKRLAAAKQAADPLASPTPAAKKK